MTTVYRCFIRDVNYRRIGELTDWTALDLVLRFNGVGTWALETSADSLDARLLARNGGIVVTRQVDDAPFQKTIFSGSVSTEWAWTGASFRAAGRSDEEILETPALPDTAGPPYTHEYDVRTGIASSIMHELAAHNLYVPYATPGRGINGLIFGVDPVIGGVITSRARFQPIITLLAELSATPYAGGLAFKLIQSDTTPNVIQFDVFVPRNRAADVKFSIDLGTAQDYEDVYQAPEGNYFYVLLGDGLGGQRSVIEGGDAASIAAVGRRIERVIDKRGITDTSEGQVALAEALAGAVSLKRTAIVPFDVPSLQYGTDYELGDLVTIVTPSGETVDLIREIEVSLDPERGPSVTPVVGRGDGSDEERMQRYIATVQDRIGNVERNWNVPNNSIIRDMLVPVLKPPIGAVHWLAGGAIPAGYLFCNGQQVSRTLYSLLFAAIGTTWGAGNGSTTFNVPSLVDRSPIGAGNGYAVGQSVGAATVTLAAHQHTGAPHTHPGSHSHGLSNHTHASQAHTHAGSHSHTLAAHRHQMGHDHDIDIGPFNTGYTNVDPVAVGHASLGSGAFDHKHSVDIANSTTTNANNTVTGSGELTGGGGAFSVTGVDATAPAATYTGLPGVPVPNSTEGDANVSAATYTASTGTAGGATVSVVHPSAGLLPVIYAGV